MPPMMLRLQPCLHDHGPPTFLWRKQKTSEVKLSFFRSAMKELRKTGLVKTFWLMGYLWEYPCGRYGTCIDREKAFEENTAINDPFSNRKEGFDEKQNLTLLLGNQNAKVSPDYTWKSQRNLWGMTLPDHEAILSKKIQFTLLILPVFIMRTAGFHMLSFLYVPLLLKCLVNL